MVYTQGKSLCLHSEFMVFKLCLIWVWNSADGWGIRSLLVSFFVIFFPEIVQRGMLYIADPPLYQIDYKPQEYVTTKKIYLDICEKIYNSKLIHMEKINSEFHPIKNSTLFRDAVEFNRQIRAMDIYRVHRNVIFSIATQTAKYRYDHKLNHHLTKDEFLDMIKHIEYRFCGPFSEIYCEKRDGYIAFAGVYDLKYMGLDMNYPVYCKIEPLINSCINIKTWEKIYIKNKANKEIMLSIAEDPMKVIECIIALMPKIKDRMKGLGQTNKEILTRTTLDPKTRTLIRVDINDDLEGAMAIIKTLRGSGMEDLQARKAMLAAFEIDADDIDN